MDESEDDGIIMGDSIGLDQAVALRAVPGRKFDALVARYFAAKSNEALQDSDQKVEPSEAIAVQLMTTAAELPRQVMIKIAVFEAELTADCDDGPCVDNRILPMFAGLKADIVRFGVGRPGPDGGEQ